MIIGLKILDTPQELRHKILNALRRQLKKPLRIAAGAIAVQMQKRFKILIMENGTVQSLIDGELRGEFGLVDAKSRIESIVDTWINSMKIVTKPITISAGGLSGGFRLQMVRSDWSDVLRLRAAIFTTPENRHRLEWLDWLLTRGGTTIIQDYDFKAQTGSGRTSQGVMSKKHKRKRWLVPYRHQGTTDNNFVTDAIKQLHKELGPIFRSELHKVFK